MHVDGGAVAQNAALQIEQQRGNYVWLITRAMRSMERLSPDIRPTDLLDASKLQAQPRRNEGDPPCHNARIRESAQQVIARHCAWSVASAAAIADYRGDRNVVVTVPALEPYAQALQRHFVRAAHSFGEEEVDAVFALVRPAGVQDFMSRSYETPWVKGEGLFQMNQREQAVVGPHRDKTPKGTPLIHELTSADLGPDVSMTDLLKKLGLAPQS